MSAYDRVLTFRRVILTKQHGVAKVAEKIVQASGMTKQNTQFLFFIPERSLSYEKIVQMSEKASSLLECFSECSLSYENIYIY